MNQAKVGIVILTYNSEKYISKCLKSLYKNKYRNFTAIIVDNNSQDQTVKTVKEHFPQVKIINNKSNLGYAAGNNIGIKYLIKTLNLSYILILNPDTIADNNLITKLVAEFENDKQIGIAGPLITYASNPNKIWYAGGYLNKLFLYTRHINMNKYLPLPTPMPSMTDFITGACMMVKKEVFENIGYLPEDYFMYFEDVDFCQRAIKSGFKCCMVNKPLLKHVVSGSDKNPGTNDLTPLRAYYFARNPFIYIKNNIIGWEKITNFTGQFIIRLPYYGMQMINKGDFKSFFQYLRGLFDGISYA